VEQMTDFIINAEELWHNTYIKGRKYSNPLRNSAAGRAYRETAALWNDGEDPDVLDTPVAHYFLSEDSGRFQGTEEIGRGFLKSYVPKFKEYFDSIKTHGYTTRLSTIPVEFIDGVPYLYDGTRRIACIVAIGKQKEITVKKADYTKFSKGCRDCAEKIVQADSGWLKSEGKRVLYQPILDVGLDDYSTDTFRKSYRTASDILLNICGNVEKKQILDVGCAYGYYSREFAKAGAYVTAVEKAEEDFSLCRRLIPLYPNMDSSNPQYVYCDIGKYIENTSLNFDVTLMLSVFQHIYAQGEARAWKTLNKIAEKSEYILLTMSSTSPKNIGKQEDIPNLILENSVLDKCKDFGPILPFGRRLFRFS